MNSPDVFELPIGEHGSIINSDNKNITPDSDSSRATAGAAHRERAWPRVHHASKPLMRQAVILLRRERLFIQKAPSVTSMSASPVPEQGQLVEVRQRQYVVSEVRPSTLPTAPLSPGSLPPAPQHLIGLTSIEDDALGEELQVIWELETGACIRERSTLPEPTGFDPPRRLDAFLDAVHWGAASSADWRTLLAPFRSGIDIEDYQLDPLVRAVQMPRVSLLIADDVGLGKTIEAGLVVQELIVRNRARTVLIVCPAALQVQWRDQMRDKFGLEFRIVNTDLMKVLRRKRGLHVNPWTHFPRLITSIDFLKRDRPLRLMREARALAACAPGSKATSSVMVVLLMKK